MNKKFYLTSFLLSVILLISFLPANSLEESNLNKFTPKPASASLYNLGLKSYEQGDLQSAVAYFKRAIDLDPEFVDAYYNLGAIYKRQKNLELAIHSFQRTIEINPKDFEATYELANCFFELKDYHSSKKYLSVITPDFSKYQDVKNKLEIASQFIASGVTNVPNLNQPGNTVQNTQATNLNQGQLLVDTLTKPKEDTSQETTSNVGTSPSSQAQVLVNTLSKPSKETLENPFKIVTHNFNGPTGIAKDSKNNLYVANFTKDQIEVISPDGKRETFAEKMGIHGPVGIAIDENDNLYVANYSGNSIIKITPTKERFLLVNNVVKPYYLLYDSRSNKLFATVQGNDSLVEIDPSKFSKQQITSAK